MISISTNLTDYFNKQAELDAYVFAVHGIEQGTIMKDHKILDLIDEIAELMNKTRVHKYWTTKGMSDKADLLEEYADGWHFILSIGNDINIHTEHYGIDIKADMRKQFLSLFFVVNEVYTPIGWNLTVSLYKGLGVQLGFTEDEVCAAYELKYKENIERQKRGY